MRRHSGARAIADRERHGPHATRGVATGEHAAHRGLLRLVGPEVRAQGAFVQWEGASLWVLGTRPGEGPYPKTDFHAHHAVQVTISLRGWFTLETRGGPPRGEAAAIAPDTDHAFAGEGMVAHLFVDPVEAGKAKPVIERIFAFEDLPRALRHVGAGRTRGQVVVRIGT